MHHHFLRPNESRPIKIKQQTFVVPADDIIVPTVRNGFLPDGVTETHERTAIVSKSFRRFDGPITAAKDNGEENRHRRPADCRRTQLFVSDDSRKQRRQQQTERRNDRKNSIDAFRRNERHDDETAETPEKEPDYFR